MSEKIIKTNKSGTGLSAQSTLIQKISKKIKLPKNNSLKKKILIVDDDKKMITSLKRWLKINNYECTITTKPLEAIHKAQKIKPDLILLDLNMPEMSGYGVLNELKKNGETSSIPVVILTGLNSKDIAMGAMNLGAVGYIVKSYILQDLVPLLNEYAADY